MSFALVKSSQPWEVSEQLELHQWADTVLLQTPVNWMGVPWRFKQYMDEIYSAGMAGQLCDGDGRSRSDPSRQYGAGGTLQGRRYMLSLTFNSPADAFNDPDQYLFAGKTVDDLFFPMHMNFRFFGMQALPTFACFDVLKNPQIESDFVRFSEHLNTHFSGIPMFTNKLHAGATFPALLVSNQNQEIVDISKPSAPADWQMVVVYRGRHCPLCTKFLNALAGFRQRLLDIGIDIAAVSADSQAQLREHGSRLEVNFPMHYGLSEQQMQDLGLYISIPRSEQEDRPSFRRARAIRSQC